MIPPEYSGKLEERVSGATAETPRQSIWSRKFGSPFTYLFFGLGAAALCAYVAYKADSQPNINQVFLYKMTTSTYDQIKQREKEEAGQKDDLFIKLLDWIGR